LPAAILLSAFLPQAITPLLALGGAYLCFEGAEKVFHALFPHADHEVEEDFDTRDPSHLEEEKVAGAIKTDFILSAEIMTIALAAIPESSIWLEAITLAIVGAGITVAVYGTVALIVKMDDVGLFMARRGRFSLTRSIGRGLVAAMPKLMAFLSTLGTAAMLWVGGQIVLHGLPEFGFGALTHWVEQTAEDAGHAAPAAATFVEWLVNAVLSGIFGLALGLVTIPIAHYVLNPVVGAVMKLFGRDAGAQAH
jgi:predicted DNA repair protein MutK